MALSFQAATSSVAVENGISCLSPRGAKSLVLSLANPGQPLLGESRTGRAIPNTLGFLSRGRHTTSLGKLDLGVKHTWRLPINGTLRFHPGQMGLRKVLGPGFSAL